MFSLSQDLQLACKGNDFRWRKENIVRGIKMGPKASPISYPRYASLPLLDSEYKVCVSRASFDAEVPEEHF